MQNTTQPKKYYSKDEYFDLEETAEIKHEFYQGEIFAMAGTTLNHNEIVQNLTSYLKEIFRPKGCRILSESVKLEVVKNIYYPYPDVMLTCHEADLQNTLMVQFPSLIIEVLSKSTEQHDKGFKWKKYQKMPSLQYYMLVSQYEIQVELYSKVENSKFWQYQAFEDLEDSIQLKALALQIPMKVIYESIIFSIDE